MNKKALTLTEMLIVIVVLGIVATFAAISAQGVLDNFRRRATAAEINSIFVAADYYNRDVGERPYGDLSGVGTCATWNADSEDIFMEGTRGGSDIESWAGPYLNKWPEETPLGGCYVYRNYKVGSQSWARSNWYNYANDYRIGTVAPADQDIELVMIRMYPINDSETIEEVHKIAEALIKSFSEEEVFYVKGQAVIAVYHIAD